MMQTVGQVVGMAAESAIVPGSVINMRRIWPTNLSIVKRCALSPYWQC